MRERRRSKIEPPDISSISRVLIIRIKSIGDLVLTTPFLSALRKWRKNLFIAFVVEEAFSPLFSSDPRIDLLIPVKRSPFGTLATAWKIRKIGFDLVINLHGGNRSALLTLLAKGKSKLGFEHFHYPFVYTHLIPHPQKCYRTDRILHTVENNLSSLLWLGIPIEEKPRLSLFLSKEIERRTKKRLNRLGVKNSFVLIHPFATLKSKEWPGEKFADLGRRIKNELHLPLIFVSEPGREKELKEKIISLSPELPYLITHTLDELVALINHCHLFIGNDAGPTHIAAALGKKIVVIFGSSDHRRWHPWGVKYSLIRHPLPCSPCPGKRCSEDPPLSCINSIEVDEVFKEVLSQINSEEE